MQQPKVIRYNRSLQSSLVMSSSCLRMSLNNQFLALLQCSKVAKILNRFLPQETAT